MVLYYKDKYGILLHEDSYEVHSIDGSALIYCVKEIEDYIKEQITEGN